MNFDPIIQCHFKFFFSLYSNFDASVGFGVITVIAGLVGTISGSELSKFLSRWTQQSDCIVCAIGLLVGTPFLYVALVIGVYNLYAAWVSYDECNMM